MGWAMPDERDEFSLEELIASFRLEGISLGGPVFDLTKLRWLNGKYIRALPVDEILARLRGELLADRYLLEVLPLAHERIDTLEDFFSYAQFFFVGEVPYDEQAIARLVVKDLTAPQTAKALRQLLEDHLDPILEWNAGTIEGALRAFCDARGCTPKQLFMPVRVAVTGRAATPPLFDTMAVLGKETCRRRIGCAIELLRSIKA
jgi:glutamyl-tRNA synthetase